MPMAVLLKLSALLSASLPKAVLELPVVLE
jgi:hypothetical protein